MLLQKERRDTNMTTQNETATTIEISNDNSSESKAPKRTMAQASQDRIAHHEGISAQKQARLETLKPGKAYDRCLKSLNENEAFITELKAGLQARLEKATAEETVAVAV